ncbi:hypothetical protein OG612_45650 (plasmid) [Streptomyces sp. NBC_01527]|uniref:hypothetical protein n=1 Tax=Streptomyces sp. NBC_01527 TaxID=2903894 RepID=UPI002F913785
MTTPQPGRPADATVTVDTLGPVLDKVALIRVTETLGRGGATQEVTHWLAGVNRVTQTPNRDRDTEYELSLPGCSIGRLPGDTRVDLWYAPEPAPAPAQQYAETAPAPQYTQPSAPAPAQTQYPQQYAQTAPAQPHYPQPSAPAPAAAPWMNNRPRPNPQPQPQPQPAAPAPAPQQGYPQQGHYPQQPQQGSPGAHIR